MFLNNKIAKTLLRKAKTLRDEKKEEKLPLRGRRLSNNGANNFKIHVSGFCERPVKGYHY